MFFSKSNSRDTELLSDIDGEMKYSSLLLSIRLSGEIPPAYMQVDKGSLHICNSIRYCTILIKIIIFVTDKNLLGNMIPEFLSVLN